MKNFFFSALFAWATVFSLYYPTYDSMKKQNDFPKHIFIR